MKTFGISHVQIEDKKMVRDMNSKAVLATDREGLNSYRDRKKAVDEMTIAISEIKTLKEEINSMKNEFKEFKDILLEISRMNRTGK